MTEPASSWRPKLVLASGSPRRLALLQQIGLEPDALLPVDLSAARAERQVRSTTAVARRDPAPVRPFRPGSSV